MFWQWGSSPYTLIAGLPGLPWGAGVLPSPWHNLPDITSLDFGNWYSLSSTHGLQWSLVARPTLGSPQIRLAETCLPFARSHWFLVSMWCIISPSLQCLWGWMQSNSEDLASLRLSQSSGMTLPCGQAYLLALLQGKLGPPVLLVCKKLTVNHHDLYTTLINLSTKKSGLWKLLGRCVSYLNI